MDGSPFLPLPDGLMIERVTETDTDLTILVQATAPIASCPRCHVQACHIHSHYQRSVADLPSGGRQVALRLADSASGTALPHSFLKFQLP